MIQKIITYNNKTTYYSIRVSRLLASNALLLDFSNLLRTKCVESKKRSTQLTRQVSVLESRRGEGFSTHKSQHLSVKFPTRFCNKRME